MANKKISELPYIDGGKISGNTLVPLVTYFSAATGDTVHTYVSDLENYLINGSYLPLTGGTVSGGTIFSTNGGTRLSIDTDVRALYDGGNGVSIDWEYRGLNNSSGNKTVDYESSLLLDVTNGTSVDWQNRTLTDDLGIDSADWTSSKRILYDNSGLNSIDWKNRRLTDSSGINKVDWENSQIKDSGGTQSIFWETRRLYDVIGLTSISYDDRKLIKSSSDVSFDWENGILTGQTNIESSTISATTYLNLPNGYYDTTGITSSQSITWDKTYWGISGGSNVDITLPSTTSKDGHILIIKDESGLAGSYRIRVTPLSGTIDGNSYIDMNINFMSLTFVARNNNWWII
jgi:hypothetical protein